MEIRLVDYPELRMIAWNRREDDVLEEAEALALYERNWFYVDKSNLKPIEQALIDHLIKTVGNGVFHV